MTALVLVVMLMFDDDCSLVERKSGVGDATSVAGLPSDKEFGPEYMHVA